MKQIQIFIPAACCLGIAVSPDTLVMLANFAGHTGYYSIGLLLPAMAVFIVFAGLFTSLGAASFDSASEARLLQNFLGPLLVYLPFFIRIFAVLFVSTGVLVSSGFVFNEVFWHRFPNFAFAFLLLAILCILHLTRLSVALHAQIWLVVTAIFGIVLLIVYGLWSGEPIPQDAWKKMPGAGVVFLPFLLWIGMDLGFFPLAGKKTMSRAMVLSVLAAGILFSLWILVSIGYVPLDRLAYTSIPHMITARHIAGDTGRALMGMVVISGSLAAVNALFLACRINAGHMAGQRLLPGWMNRPRVLPILLAGAIAVMMAMGMAGSPLLESWIRATFVLWLLSLAVTGIAFYLQTRHPGLPAAACLALAAGIFILKTGDKTMLIMMLIGFMLAIALTAGGFYGFKTHKNKPGGLFLYPLKK